MQLGHFDISLATQHSSKEPLLRRCKLYLHAWWLARKMGVTLDCEALKDCAYWECKIAQKWRIFGAAHIFEHNVSLYADPGFIGSYRWYAMTLHELGHMAMREECQAAQQESIVYCSDDIVRMFVTPRRVRNEHRAWQWALRNAIVWNREMYQLRQEALETYNEALTQAVESETWREVVPAIVARRKLECMRAKTDTGWRG